MATNSTAPSPDATPHTRVLRLTQIYKALSEINQAIVRLEDCSEICALVCRVAVQYGGASMAWMGQHDPQSGTIVPADAYGEHTDYLDDILISTDGDRPEGKGPAASAWREGQAVVINHFTTDPMTTPWHERARRAGWGSVGSFPIPRGDKPYAVLTVYHGADDFFDDETVSLLAEMARDVGFALTNFDIEQERQAALAALKTSEAHFRAYFERSMVGMAATRPDQSWIEANDALCNMLGYSQQELTRLTWAELTHPEDLPGNQQLFDRMRAGELDEYTLEKRFIHRNGHAVDVHLAARAIRDPDGKLLYAVSLAENITARKQAEQRDSLRNAALELMTRGAALSAVLHKVIDGIQSSHPEMICSVLLLDTEGTHLLNAAAPSLPSFYNDAIHGGAIGPGEGSCGTAAYTGERVVVADIATHPYWDNYRDVALAAGLAAAWSEPVRAASGEVLGTFAIYHSRPTTPDSYEIALIENAANLVGIAIERRRSEEERFLASMIYQSSSEGTLVTDSDNRIIAINPAFTRITGYQLDDIRGKSPSLLRSNRHEPAFYAAMWTALQTDGFWQGEIWNRRQNGDVFPAWLTVNTIRDDEGQILRYVAQASDITNKVRSDELIWRQANFDFLTSLPNRYMFHDRLEQEIRNVHRDNSRLALLFIDLDHFKDINDSLGHHIGDQLLVTAAERVQKCIRESDSVARLGGDEFTVILTHINDTGDAERVAQQIITTLSDPFTIQSHELYISASVGITLCPDDSDDVDQLLSNADQAMYVAKQNGRNRLCYFTPSLHQSAHQRLTLIHDLRHALEASEFEVYYQPIIDLSSDKIDKAESLLRWNHPTRGRIGPDEFIPLAEETGLIVGIGDWVLRQSAAWAAGWSRRGIPLQISVNMSPVQFQSDALVIDDWLAYLRTLELSPQQINVEITEGLLLNAMPAVTNKLLRFRDAGIQVSIDDFGTGYSALSYLKRFDIDFLKIDQSFISHLESDANNLALCEAIVMMAHKLGLKVIAEGVETEAQRQALLGIGCDYGQGYLFSRALPAGEFETYLQGRG